MLQYINLLQDIIYKGTWKESARTNMPRTKSLFGTRMEFDMKDGFPLLTTKKMYYNSIIIELLWFLKGDTNIKYLVDNGCNIWNQDAYRWYLKKMKELDDKFYNNFRWFPVEQAEFIEIIKEGNLESSIPNYQFGDLGKVYGEQWRNQNGVDQLNTCIDRLKSDPMGRYVIIDAWNPSDFSEMALPPCHLLYQFNCRALSTWERKSLLSERENWIGQDYLIDEDPSGDIEDIMEEELIPKYYLDLQMYQRSCDTFLGVPFNIASASLLLHLIAKVVNMIPSKFVWVGGDTHIYENHLGQVEEQLSRDSLTLSKLKISKDLNSLEDLVNLNKEDIEILNYKSHSAIKGELKTGL